MWFWKWTVDLYCHVYEWLQMEVGLEIGFIDHFNTWLVTVLNYSAIANLHTSPITTAHSKSFQSAVFTTHSLVAASNSGGFSASTLTSLLTGSQLHRLCLLFTDTLTTELLLQLSSLQHLGTDRTENTIHCCTPIVSMGTVCVRQH
jgi:hypothetical protein